MVRNRHGMASLIVLTGCAYALAAAAFPSRAELDKAEKLVNEIMSTDVAAFKAKSKTAADVASAALGYADEAQGEAARFLLLKGAFVFQVRAADYDGAKATVGRIRAEISGVPDKVVADMLSSALRRVPRKHCGQLFELLQRTQNRVRYAQELQTLAQKTKAVPSDGVSHARMGELHALLGNWEQAVVSFAAVGGGKRAEVASWEMAYPKADGKFDAAAVADFWWGASSEASEDLAAAYRAHAADWYRIALKDNALPGLKRTLAEKRIAEAEKDADAIAAPAPQGVAAPKVAAVKSDPSQPPPKTLRLGRGADIEFVGCPAGSFMMGTKGDGRPRSVFRYHKVNITRPFWLSKYKVTHGMWNAYQKVSLTKEDNALGGMKRVHCVSASEAEAFCAWLTKRCRSNLPKGYVVRMPTEAEWEYALKANVTDPGDSYALMWNRTRDAGGYVYSLQNDNTVVFAFPEVKDCLVVWPLDVNPRLKAAGLWTTEREEAEKQGYKGTGGSLFSSVRGTEVGTKKPNAWGLFDMLGNRGELMSDMIDRSRVPREGNRARWEDQDAVCYADVETDPLRYVPQDVNGKSLCFSRGGHVNFGWAVCPRSKNFPYKDSPFRLCIGPDLMKEKGFKK